MKSPDHADILLTSRFRGMGVDPMWMSDDLLTTDAELSAARWVRRRLGSWTHERRVLSIADTLYDLTHRRLNLGPADRRLLRLAAIVHDIGRALSEKRHPVEGAKLIARTGALSISPFDRRALAYFTRYHRGAVPLGDNLSTEAYLHPTDNRRRIRGILALLRVADALDSRQIESPELMFHLDRHRMDIRCFVKGDLESARHVYRRRKKFFLLEELLDCPIHVRVERIRSIAHAA